MRPLDKIIHGDALEILKELPSHSIDTIITDPVWPNALKVLAGADDPFALFKKAAKHFPRVARTVVIHLGCSSDPRFLLAMPKKMPFLRTCWLRYNFPSYRGRLLVGSDVAYVFGKPPPVIEGKRLMPGECNANDTDMDISVARKFHPCARKLTHVQWLVEKFSNPGETILDPFAGSGTTLVAAKYLNRHYLGIEIEKKYCQMAEERLKQEIFNF